VMTPPENWNFVIFLYFENRFLGNRWGCFVDFICTHRGLRVHSDCEKSQKWITGKFEFFSVKMRQNLNKSKNIASLTVRKFGTNQHGGRIYISPFEHASESNDSDHAKCGGVLYPTPSSVFLALLASDNFCLGENAKKIKLE